MKKRMKKIMLILLSVLMLHSLLPIAYAEDKTNNESTPSIVSNKDPLFETNNEHLFAIGVRGSGYYNVKRNGNKMLSKMYNPYTINLNHGNNLELSATANEGHTFLGWYEATLGGDNYVNGYTNNLISTNNPYSFTLNNDFKVAAVFVENASVVTITFNTRGGTPIEPQTILPGGKAIRPDNPTRYDAVFDNWYTDENFTTTFDFDTSLNNNITLYARWKYNTNVYPETPSTNNGYAYIGYNISGIWAKEKDTLTLTAYPDEGYRLKHWKDIDTEEILSEENPFNYVVDKRREIEAIFVENKYTITFNTRGADPIESQTILPGGKAIRPDNPTRYDAVFDNWYTDENFTTTFDFDTSLNNNITLYARWKYYTNLYPKKNNPNNGYALIDTYYGGQWDKEKDTITLTAHPDEGYRLKHWKDINTGEILSKENPFSFTVDKNRQIEAIFVENKYTITFHTRGGTPIEPQIVIPGEKPIKPDDPTKESADIKFQGWYLDEDFKNSFIFRTAVVDDDIDLYARWYIKYEIYPKNKDNNPRGRAYFNTLGAKPTDYLMAEGASIDIVAQAYDGYVFGEWRIGSESGELLSTNNPYTLTAKNADKKIDIYAIIYPKYDITFNYNGYSYKGNNLYNISFMSEEELTISDVIDKDDDVSILYRQNLYPQIKNNDDYYVVTGWYLEPECINEFNIINTKVTKNITLYAKWVKLSPDDYVIDKTNESSYAEVYFNGYIINNGSRQNILQSYGGQVDLAFDEQTNNEIKETLAKLRSEAPDIAYEKGYRIKNGVDEEVIYEIDHKYDNRESYYLDYSHKDAKGNYVYTKDDIVETLTNPAKRVELKEGECGKKELVFLNIMIEPIPITKINILKDISYVEVGGSGQSYYFIEIEPANATRDQLQYISSNPNAVNIDSAGFFGLFRGEAVGESIITVKADSGVSNTYKVIVLDKIIYVDSIKLNKTKLELEKGKSERLSVSISPSNAHNKFIHWRSNNEAIATVDQNGKVTAKKIGTAKIYAYATDGSGEMHYCNVTVKAKGLAQPKLINIYNSAKGADIRFKPVDNATEYVLMRKTDGVWASVKTVKAADVIKINTNQYQIFDETIKNNYGKGYIYSVAAKNNKETSKYDTKGLAIYRLKAPTITNIVANGNGKVTLTWSKETCHGYEIQYSSDNGTNWLKYPEIKDPNKTTITINNLDKNKTYVFRIRCQKTNPDRGVGWSQYSSWAKVNVK